MIEFTVKNVIWKIALGSLLSSSTLASAYAATTTPSTAQHRPIGHSPSQLLTPSDIGVKVTSPPKKFDPLTATNAQLAKYHFPPRPKTASALSKWETMMKGYKAFVIPKYKEFKRNPHTKLNSSKNTTMNAAASTSTASSPSWAGYLNHTNDVNEVWGQWIVPSAYDTSTPYGNWAESYTWVGMGGFTDTAFISGNHGNIMQAGTEQNMIMNNYQQQAAYYFWWECYPYNAEQIVNLAVNPGDSVYSQVWYTTNNGGTMNYFMENYTTGQSTSGALSGVSAYYDPTEAEWIEEDPTLDGGGGRANLADFGSVNLQDCYSYSPTQGTQSISGYNNLRINMGSKASTGGLNSSGDGFTVTWHNFN